MKLSFVLTFLIFIFIHSVNAQQFKPGFFCFEDAFLLSPDYTIENQAYLLKNLGFDGIELEGLDNADEKLRILEKYNLKPYMVYIQVDIDKEKPL